MTAEDQTFLNSWGAQDWPGLGGRHVLDDMAHLFHQTVNYATAARGIMDNAYENLDMQRLIVRSLRRRYRDLQSQIARVRPDAVDELPRHHIEPRVRFAGPRRRTIHRLTNELMRIEDEAEAAGYRNVLR